MQPNEGKQPSTIRGNLTWIAGVVLILLGVVFLVGQLYELKDWIWSGVLIVAGLAFASIFVINRTQWWALIPAYVLVLVGLFIPLADEIPDLWIPAYWMGAVGLPFLVVYLTRPRERWWALIPAYVMLVVGAFVPFTAVLPGVWIPAYWMGAIALPFLVVFVVNRKAWWALIPMYVGLVVAAFVPLAQVLPNLWIPAYWMFAIALPFYVVFLSNLRRWWALIPAGIMTLLGLAFVIATARYVTYVVPAVLILAGLILLVRQSTLRPEPPPPATPTFGPEADKPRE